MPTRSCFTAIFIVLAGCGADQDAAPDAGPAERPAARTDSIALEGAFTPIRTVLFRAPEDFPLPFSAYVPEDLTTEAEQEDEGAGGSVRFVAAFGGTAEPDAFLHVYAYPEGTHPQEALGVVRAYQESRGVPVSRGIEPLPDLAAGPLMAWADSSYAFRYQAGGEWFHGTIGLGTRNATLYHMLLHHPAEYGDGFGPRAALILRTWRWADGSTLLPSDSR